MIVATAGHVDHGKTTLVRTLTGVDTDRLPEEKRRGMSIDLGFAYLPVEGAQPVAFVDVPGHERFVRNMVAGVQAIDLAVLVIAADDGPMPQTREHLDILRHLGVADVWVFLSKLDRVDQARAHAVRREVAAFGSRVYEDSSSLRQALLEASANRSTRSAEGLFRMYVDRSFALDGVGTVVTGTVVKGRVRAGDRLTIMPQGIEVRVRTVRANNCQVAEAAAGQRCALGLQGVSRDEVARGDVVAAGEDLVRTRRADLALRLQPGVAARLRRPVLAHFGTCACEAQLAIHDDGLARLTFAREVTLWHGDTVLLRDAAAGTLLGSGQILDALPARRGMEQARVLQAVPAATPRDALGRLQVADLRWVAANWQVPLHEASDAAIAGGLRRFGAYAASQNVWDGLRQAIRQAVENHHAQSPLEVGLPVALLRRRFAGSHPALLDAVLGDALHSGDLVRCGGDVRLPHHQVELSQGEEALFQRMAPLLDGRDGKPARVHELAEALGTEAREVEALLVRAALAGRVLRVARNRFFLPATVERMVCIARELDRDSQAGGFSAAQFRDRSALGRNLTIEVLEFLDRCGYTQRRGALRRMVEPNTEEERTPVGRTDFKSAGRRLAPPEGSTPSSSAASSP